MKQFEEFEMQLQWFKGFITEPNITYTEGGKCKTVFSIPLKKNKDDEAKWVNCSCWGSLAEKVSEFKKGTAVIVAGYFTEREYKDKKYLDFNVQMVNEC